MPDEAQIEERLTEVMNSIFCPVVGCWSFYGGHSSFDFDHNSESYVLEVWPVGFEEPESHKGNGHEQSEEKSLCYELAEFDFTGLANEVPLEDFHFSQRRSLFEIAWQEDGQRLELRVNIVPVEAGEE